MRSGGWGAGVGQDFHQVWSRWQQADTILVDIPIGLRESGQQERLCDPDARRILGPPRSSSVFPVPCRPSLYVREYREASRVIERHTGRRPSRQSWNIAGKIREVFGFCVAAAKEQGKLAGQGFHFTVGIQQNDPWLPERFTRLLAGQPKRA
jgi:predicted RNase H-like nuclease